MSKITHQEDFEDAMVDLADFLRDRFDLTHEQIDAVLYLQVPETKSVEDLLSSFVGFLDFRHTH